MGDSNVPQYPFMFPASEWSNKYSTMNSQQFPMYNYYGTPTDAMGNPIDSYKPPATPAQTPGTTISSSPQPTGTWTSTPRSNVDSGGRGTYTGNELHFVQTPGQAGQSQQGQQGQGPPQGNLAYLLALANPNKVVTPGVTPPPRASQPGNFDIDSFIAQLKGSGAAQPPGGYATGATGMTGVAPSNGFLQTLAALRAGSPGKA